MQTQAQVTRREANKRKNLGSKLVQKSDCCVQNPRIKDFFRQKMLNKIANGSKTNFFPNKQPVYSTRKLTATTRKDENPSTTNSLSFGNLTLETKNEIGSRYWKLLRLIKRWNSIIEQSKTIHTQKLQRPGIKYKTKEDERGATSKQSNQTR